MDNAYLRPRKSNFIAPIVILLVIVTLVGGAAYFLLNKKDKFLSPVPPEPDFEVIFYTPTPRPITPSSTPSATPKVKKSVPTSTPKPVKPTATATPETQPSPTLAR